MPTATSKPTRGLVRRVRSSVDELNETELLFIRHLIADDLWRPTEAARKAGLKSPYASASNMMKKPAVQRALGHEQRRRLERLQLKADEVLHFLATGLFFNPLSLFKPSKSGAWLVEDLDKIPDEIGRLVEEVKTRTVESCDDQGNVSVTTYFEIRVISKTRLLELAMRHCGVDGSSKIEFSGNVGLKVGLEGGLNGLLMEIESTRAGQIIDEGIVDGKVITRGIEDDQG
jgi:phage terminase small subunit